jgi:serine protease Do
MRRNVYLVAIGVALGAAITFAPIGLGGGPSSTSGGGDAVVERLAPLTPPAPTVRPDATYNPTRSFGPLVDAVTPAVVAIEVEGEEAGLDASDLPWQFRQFMGIDPRQFQPHTVHGEGSGFVVSADGLVLTNHHVIEHAKSIKANFSNGRSVRAKVLGSDATIDVALLQLDGDGPWPFVELGSSKDAHVGDWVLAVGNPLGLGHTVTAGIVSAKGRTLGHDAFEDFIQTDAAINQGNSGGPLFDVDGRVIGINTAIIQGANTIGFAVPIDMIRATMADLQAKGHVSRGYMGIAPQDVDEGVAKAFGVEPKTGALVAQVYPGTPGADAGLRQGDIIVAVEGEPIKDAASLVRSIGSHKPGDTVALGVVRDKKPLTLKVALTERPGPGAEPGRAPTKREPVVDQTSKLGLQLHAMPPQAAHRLGVEGGVVIDHVGKDSPAQDFLRDGDVILEVNRWPVTTPEDVDTIIGKSKGKALFLIQRGEEQRFVAVPIAG